MLLFPPLFYFINKFIYWEHAYFVTICHPSLSYQILNACEWIDLKIHVVVCLVEIVCFDIGVEFQYLY